jgi:hypothetical protein
MSIFITFFNYATAYYILYLISEFLYVFFDAAFAIYVNALRQIETEEAFQEYIQAHLDGEEAAYTQATHNID